MAKVLGREDILSASDRQTVTVPVPEWGGDVLVRGLTGKERDRFDESLMEETKGRGGRRERRVRWNNARARLCAMCIVDETGRRLFTMEDVQALGEKGAAAVQRVYDVAASLSGLSSADLDELLGNSDGQSDDSPSA